MILEEKGDEYFLFLECLKESGVTNMLGASPYLEEQFEELNGSDSRKVLALWIESYRQIPKAWNKETMGENK